MKEELVYYERQRFNQWWVVLMIVFINVSFITGCIIGKLWGNSTEDDIALIIATLLLALITSSIFFIRLDTVINKDGVYERMLPFQLKSGFTSWDNISDIRVMKINPIRKFGGWGVRFKLVNIGGHGIRYGIGKKAYTISGNNVLQMTLKNNKKIFIGTQKPEELAEFLSKINAERKQE